MDGHYYKKISSTFFLSLSCASARFLLFLHVLCFSIDDSCVRMPFQRSFSCSLFRLFPHFLRRALSQSPLFFSFCILPSAFARWLCRVLPCINYEVLSFCHATGRTIATREREKKMTTPTPTTTKNKKSCRCCYQCRCTHLARSFFSLFTERKRTNSCNYDANIKKSKLSEEQT